MRLKIGVVIDPWDYPYNGTVVSTRRFVSELRDDFDFRLLATPDPSKSMDDIILPFPKLSIPGFNQIIERMKVPLANPWGHESVTRSLAGLDVLHMQFPFFLGAVACRKAKQLGIPLICSFHVQPENLLHNLGLRSQFLAKWLYKLFVWQIYQHADLVLAPSQFAADQLWANGYKGLVEVLSNGVPEEFFGLERKTGKIDAEDKFRILSVGRMAPEKHHQMMIRAVAKSRHKHKIHLSLVGTGPLEEALRLQVKAAGLDAELGRVDDAALMRHYQRADLFVHAGEIELEGMSVLEAMAAAKTVLVSDSVNSAAVELVDNENALFNCYSEDDLAQKIDFWIEHPEMRENQSVHNRSKAKLRHHRDSVAQLKGIYQRLAKQSVNR